MTNLLASALEGALRKLALNMKLKNILSTGRFSKRFGTDYILILKSETGLKCRPDMKSVLEDSFAYVTEYGETGYRFLSKQPAPEIHAIIDRHTGLSSDDYVLYSTLAYNALRL